MRSYAESICIPAGSGIAFGLDNFQLRQIIPDLPLELAFRIYWRYLYLVGIIRGHRGSGELIRKEIKEKGMILTNYPGLRK